MTPGDQLVNASTAAERLRTTVNVICMWRNRGHLPVARRDSRGRPLYRWDDLLTAERTTRQTRTSGARGGVRRTDRLADVRRVERDMRADPRSSRAA